MATRVLIKPDNTNCVTCSENDAHLKLQRKSKVFSALNVEEPL